MLPFTSASQLHIVQWCLSLISSSPILPNFGLKNLYIGSCCLPQLLNLAKTSHLPSLFKNLRLCILIKLDQMWECMNESLFQNNGFSINVTQLQCSIFILPLYSPGIWETWFSPHPVSLNIWDYPRFPIITPFIYLLIFHTALTVSVCYIITV